MAVEGDLVGGARVGGLEVDGVSVAYPAERGAPQVVAVSDAHLRVPRGRIAALLGPSGSGKSTLLRAIAGLEPLSGGRVVFDGEDLDEVAVHRREFGLVFQDGQLFAHLNVARNIEYGLRAHRVPSADRAARVRELLDLVGMPGYEDRPVTTLSGGQRQRIALARSLAPRPRLVLLDEPLSALDQELRERLAADLRRILKHTGSTALYVTHDRGEAESVADESFTMVQIQRGAAT